MARAARSPHGHGAARTDVPRGVAGDRWTPPVHKTVASRGEGIDALIDACEAHRAFLDDPSRREVQRQRRAEAELRAIFEDSLLELARERLGHALDEGTSSIVAGANDPYTVTERLLSSLVVSEGKA